MVVPLNNPIVATINIGKLINTIFGQTHIKKWSGWSKASGWCHQITDCRYIIVAVTIQLPYWDRSQWERFAGALLVGTCTLWLWEPWWIFLIIECVWLCFLEICLVIVIVFWESKSIEPVRWYTYNWIALYYCWLTVVYFVLIFFVFFNHSSTQVVNLFSDRPDMSMSVTQNRLFLSGLSLNG